MKKQVLSIALALVFVAGGALAQVQPQQQAGQPAGQSAVQPPSPRSAKAQIQFLKAQLETQEARMEDLRRETGTAIDNIKKECGDPCKDVPGLAIKPASRDEHSNTVEK